MTPLSTQKDSDNHKNPPDNPGHAYVLMRDCVERHKKISEDQAKIVLALFGIDGRGGMVLDLSEIKTTLKGFQQWRTTAIALTTGVVGAVVAYILSHLWRR